MFGNTCDKKAMPDDIIVSTAIVMYPAFSVRKKDLTNNTQIKKHLMHFLNKVFQTPYSGIHIGN